VKTEFLIQQLKRSVLTSCLTRKLMLLKQKIWRINLWVL